MPANSKRGGLLSRLLVESFTRVGFVLRPLFKLLVSHGVRDNVERLREDIQNEMTWVISNLHPELIPVASRRKTLQYTAIILKTPDYLVRITRENYHGGEDFWADVAPSSNPAEYFRIDVVAKALCRINGQNGLSGPRGLLRTLSDLDSLIQSTHLLLKEHFSPQHFQDTRSEIRASMVQRASIN